MLAAVPFCDMHLTRLLPAALLLLIPACGGAGTVAPKVLDTFAYGDGSSQRVACCTGREEQLSSGKSVEYPLAGVPWWDGTWHEGDSGPVSCIKSGEGQRTPVRVGYLETEVSDDAPGTTIIAWLRCGR